MVNKREKQKFISVFPIVDGKRGFLRIVEASIAILVILAAVLLLLSRGEEKVETDFNALLTPILEEMAQDTSLREDILEYKLGEQISNNEKVNNENIIGDLNDFVGDRITNPSLDYYVVICDLEGICPIDYPVDIRGNLYANERVISTTLEERGCEYTTCVFHFKHGN